MAVSEIDESYALLSYYADLEAEIVQDRPQDVSLLRQTTNPHLLYGSDGGVFAVQELLPPEKHIIFSIPLVTAAISSRKERHEDLPESETARKTAQSTYRVLEENARENGDERSKKIAGALDTIAYYAGIEGKIAYDRPRDAARLSQNGNFSLLPGSGSNYGSIIDVRPLLEPDMQHVLYAAVKTRDALDEETGNREINLTRGDFTEVNVSGLTVNYPVDSLTIKRRIKDITTMLGATNRRLVNESDPFSRERVYHHDTNIGLTLIETVTNNTSSDGVPEITLFARKKYPVSRRIRPRVPQAY